MVFDDEFNSLNLISSTNPHGVWETTYAGGDRAPTSSVNAEFYSDPSYDGLGLNPFSVNNGILTIQAMQTPAADLSKVDNQPYVSGIINSSESFSQTYGYFEISAQFPAGKGLWPAFWLLPTTPHAPNEIDVVEAYGDQTSVDNTTIHALAGVVTQANAVANMTTGFHTYGVDWEPTTTTFYMDGKEVYQTPTPAGMNNPMYMIANLQVFTGNGGPNAATTFPADMEINYIRAYASANTIPNINTDPVTAASTTASGSGTTTTTTTTGSGTGSESGTTTTTGSAGTTTTGTGTTTTTGSGTTATGSGTTTTTGSGTTTTGSGTTTTTGTGTTSTTTTSHTTHTYDHDPSAGLTSLDLLVLHHSHWG